VHDKEMQNLGAQHFLLFFAALWLGITTLLGVLSGWFALAHRYPDRNEQPLLVLRGQSGSMALGVRMNNILKISVCPSGLRVGILKIFGPFCRDFFVPWNAISIERRKYFFIPVAELQFGTPSNGKLMLAAYVANRLAKSAGENWPEKEVVFQKSHRETVKAVFLYWLLGTSVASAFFLIVPRLASPKNSPVPWWIAIGFPASVLGFVSILRYWNIVKGSRD
jgi:hypothetical protein